MTQQTVLLEALETYRKSLTNYARKLSRNEEAADDVMQHVVVRILQKTDWNYEIENPFSFLSGMVWQIVCNTRRTNKKYVFVPDQGVDGPSEDVYFEKLSQFATPCEYAQDMEYSLILRDIKKQVNNLTKKQKQAILSALAGENMGSVHEKSYETNKTHRRLGMLRLRELLGG